MPTCLKVLYMFIIMILQILKQNIFASLCRYSSHMQPAVLRLFVSLQKSRQTIIHQPAVELEAGMNKKHKPDAAMGQLRLRHFRAQTGRVKPEKNRVDAVQKVGPA
ncbi:MAG: hypothetical protein LC725_08815 [Lentisphaerae bacterium]|nr:hypothetical protein [Lentisphaerota bacterium]